LNKNLGLLLISATIDNPNINAQGFLPEGEELKASYSALHICSYLSGVIYLIDEWILLLL